MGKSLKIIISPAKKMNPDPDGFAWEDLPVFLDKAQLLCETMQGMTFAELKKLWKCNDAIAELNVQRLNHMDLRRGLTPAILTYEGIQYRSMAPGVFSETELEYVQKHLRILSGFYGILRPLDGIRPYRLEMQAKLAVQKAKDLYSYWGCSLADTLQEDADCIVNLASKEYSVCISRYIPDSLRFLTCVFGEQTNGKIIEKATLCKMARGEMVRYMAQTGAEHPEQIQAFDRLGFRYAPEHSDENRYVFLRVAAHR